MRYAHILIEGYCEFSTSRTGVRRGAPCADCKGKLGPHCLECRYFSYAPAPYELSVSNSFGLVEKRDGWVAPCLDADDYPDLTEAELNALRRTWSDICRKKIDEAWKEYTAQVPLPDPHALHTYPLTKRGETAKYRCPCCGELCLPEKPPGTYQICPVCGWEDDEIQYRDPAYVGGANGSSLNDARKQFEAAQKADDPEGSLQAGSIPAE